MNAETKRSLSFYYFVLVELRKRFGSNERLPSCRNNRWNRSTSLRELGTAHTSCLVLPCFYCCLETKSESRTETSVKTRKSRKWSGKRPKGVETMRLKCGFCLNGRFVRMVFDGEARLDFRFHSRARVMRSKWSGQAIFLAFWDKLLMLLLLLYCRVPLPSNFEDSSRLHRLWLSTQPCCCERS